MIPYLPFCHLLIDCQPVKILISSKADNVSHSWIHALSSKAYGVKAEPEVWPVLVSLCGQSEEALQSGTPGMPQTWSCHMLASAPLFRGLCHHWAKPSPVTAEEIKPAKLRDFLSQGCTVGHGKNCQASSPVSYTVVFWPLPRPPLQGSGLLPWPPVDFLRVSEGNQQTLIVHLRAIP